LQSNPFRSVPFPKGIKGIKGIKGKKERRLLSPYSFREETPYSFLLWRGEEQTRAECRIPEQMGSRGNRRLVKKA